MFLFCMEVQAVNIFRQTTFQVLVKGTAVAYTPMETVNST